MKILGRTALSTLAYSLDIFKDCREHLSPPISVLG
jgi:hypothetical protein